MQDQTIIIRIHAASNQAGVTIIEALTWDKNRMAGAGIQHMVTAKAAAEAIAALTNKTEGNGKEQETGTNYGHGDFRGTPSRSSDRSGNKQRNKAAAPRLFDADGR